MSHSHMLSVMGEVYRVGKEGEGRKEREKERGKKRGKRGRMERGVR